MAVFGKAGSLPLVAADDLAAQALAREMAAQSGEPVKLFTRDGGDLLVTRDSDPGPEWTCTDAAYPPRAALETSDPEAGE